MTKLTQHEANVLEFMKNSTTPLTGVEVAKELGISVKSATSTLARLNKTLGLVSAIIPNNLTQYYVNTDETTEEVE